MCIHVHAISALYMQSVAQYHWKQPHPARPYEYREHYACMWCLSKVFLVTVLNLIVLNI